MSRDAKLVGIRQEIDERGKSKSAAILLIAHFSDTLETLDGLAAEYAGEVPLRTTLSSHLTDDLASGQDLDETALIDLIVAERHPLLSVDERLCEFAEELPCRTRMIHLISIDEPIFKRFAGEWVTNVLKQLGMKDDEAIESRMVARRVRDAQREIEVQALSNIPANSAEQWIAQNLAPH